MAGFARDGDAYVVTLGRNVGEQIVALCDQVINAMADPESPSVRRLFPDASDVEEVAAEFRELTESDARQEKTDRLLWLQTVCSDPSGEVRIPTGEASRFSAAINDLRLVLGEWLGISSDEQLPKGWAARAYGRAVYDLLTWLQDSLIELLLEDLGEAGRH